MKSILVNFRCATLDFLKAKKIKSNANPIGARARVSKGNTEKITLTMVRTMAIINKVFLMIIFRMLKLMLICFSNSMLVVIKSTQLLYVS